MPKYNGHGGSITMASTTIAIHEWKYTGSVDELDVTDSGSSGNQEVIAGTNKGKFEIKAFLGATGLTALSGVTEGTTGTMVGTLGTSTKTISASVLITSLSTGATTGSVIEVNISATKNGAVTYA